MGVSVLGYMAARPEAKQTAAVQLGLVAAEEVSGEEESRLEGLAAEVACGSGLKIVVEILLAFFYFLMEQKDLPAPQVSPLWKTHA